MARRAAKGELNDKQKLFVAEYLKDSNGTEAAKRAGYSPKTAHSQASDLLKNPKVAQAVAAAQARRLERVELKADDILRELLRIATSDLGQAFDEDGNLRPIHEIPVDVRRAMSGIEVDEIFEGRGEERTQVGVTRKVKFWDKPRALELLGKNLKLFTDKVEHSGGATITVIDPYAEAPAAEPKPDEKS